MFVLRGGTCWALGLIVQTIVGSLAPPSASAGEVSFRDSIAPILLANCLGCHNERTLEGGYDVTSYASLFIAGESGSAAILPGNAADSEMYRRLITTDLGERMPAESDALPPGNLRLVEQWIREGARFDFTDKRASLATVLRIRRHPVPPQRYRFPTPVRAIAFSQGSLFVGGYHEILRWDAAAGRMVHRIPQVGERVYNLVVDEERGRLIVASGSPGTLGEVRIFHLKSMQLLAVPLATTDVVLDVVLHPNQDRLAAASADGRVYLIDPHDKRETKEIRSHSDWVRSVAWNQDGSRFATTSRDKTAKVFDTETGRLIATYRGHEQDVLDVVFSKEDETKLISSDAAGTIHLWQLADGEQLKVSEFRVRPEGRIHSSDDGVWLASDGKLVKLAWDVEAQLAEMVLPEGRVLSLATNRDPAWLAVGDATGLVHYYDLVLGRLIDSFVGTPSTPPRAGIDKRSDHPSQTAD